MQAEKKVTEGNSIEKVIHQRTEAILEHFRADPIAPLISISPTFSLSPLERMNDGRFHKHHDGSVLRFESNRSPDQSFTMVLPSFPNYRNEYVGFLNSTYKTNFLESDLPKGLDIDHLLAASNSPSLTWVRLEALPIRINRSHGGGAEKKNARSRIADARKRAEHRPGTMNWLVAAKLASLMSPLSPKSKNSQSRLEAIVEYFVELGFVRAQVEGGLKSCQHQLAELGI